MWNGREMLSNVFLAIGASIEVEFIVVFDDA
jgi:hypothetical protein